MSGETWRVRPAGPLEMHMMRDELTSELVSNSYFYGVSRSLCGSVAENVISGNAFESLVVEPNDESDEPAMAGWVIFQRVPQLCVAMAYVEPSFRGLGAWRALREAIGLQKGQYVSCVLQGPKAMSEARKHYRAKHNWGRIVEWLL